MFNTAKIPNSEGNIKTRPSIKLGLVLTSIFSLIGGCVGYIEHQAHSFIYAYTEPKPAVTKSNIDAQKKLDMSQRLLNLQSALNKKQPVTLVLSGEDLNILVNQNSRIPGAVHLNVVDDKVILKMSILLDGFPGFNKRVLNAILFLNVSFKNGFLLIQAEKMKICENEIPETFMKEYKTINLAQDLMTSQKFKTLTQQLKSLEVKNSQVVFKY